MTIRRVLGAVAILLLLALAYTAYEVWRVERDLTQAQSSGQQLVSAVRHGDAPAREKALTQFASSSRSAHRHTSGFWWGGMAHLPVVGDDAHGIAVLSAQLDQVSTNGARPMVQALDSLDHVTEGGRLNLQAIRDLQAPVDRAHSSFAQADTQVGQLDSSGYVGILRTRFDNLQATLDQVTQGLDSADTATHVLPSFLGGEGTRHYLLVFQNNAEIRATGGQPGSWAEVRADNGQIDILRQGTAAEFGAQPNPVLPLTQAEEAVYTPVFGQYFQDATFTPNFPRAAALLAATWHTKYSDHLDGVISIDPVTLSYMLNGTGPVTVEGRTLTPQTAIPELLSRPYLADTPTQQDAFFAAAAKAIFDKATTSLVSPPRFAQALVRAANEGRFLVAPFREQDEQALAGTQVLGAVPNNDGNNPHVIIGLSAATATKMSYYLRYNASVQAASCQNVRQTLLGTMSLSQTITQAQAAKLPVSVLGPGAGSIPPGAQFVAVRIYGPTGGTVGDIKIDAKAIDATSVELDNRPVVTLAVLVDGSHDVSITWSMRTGPAQAGHGTVSVTPSVVPGTSDSTFASAC